jgi:hypothetical protein
VEKAMQILAGFRQEVKEDCGKVGAELLNFLGQDAVCIVAIWPYGIYFADIISEYLKEVSSLRVEEIVIGKEVSVFVEDEILAKKVLLVDDGRHMSADQYRSLITRIKTCGAAGIMYVTYQKDQEGLYDLALHPSLEEYVECYKCGDRYVRSVTNRVQVLSRYYCPRKCLRLAKQDIYRVRNAFLGTGKKLLGPEEVAVWINDYSGFKRFSKERAEHYLQTPELFQLFAPGLYRMK